MDKFNLSIKVDDHKIFNWLSILLTKMQSHFSIGHEIQVTILWRCKQLLSKYLC